MVETESISFIVSDRMLPQMLSFLNKVDLLLTICLQIPTKHHFFFFTCLLASDSHILCPIKIHRNKQAKKSQSKSYFHATDLSQDVSVTAPE